MKRFLFDMLTLTLGICLLIVVGAFIEGGITFFATFGLSLTLIACIRLSHIESTRKHNKFTHRKTIKPKVTVPHIVPAKTSTQKQSAHSHVRLNVA